MIREAVILSLQITAIQITFQQGMLLGWLRVYAANFIDFIFEKPWNRIVQKPLWDCLPCMAGLWTIVLSWNFNIKMILLVCGINVFIDKLLNVLVDITIDNGNGYETNP